MVFLLVAHVTRTLKSDIGFQHNRGMCELNVLMWDSGTTGNIQESKWEGEEIQVRNPSPGDVYKDRKAWREEMGPGSVESDDKVSSPDLDKKPGFPSFADKGRLVSVSENRESKTAPREVEAGSGFNARFPQRALFMGFQFVRFFPFLVQGKFEEKYMTKRLRKCRT